LLDSLGERISLASGNKVEAGLGVVVGVAAGGLTLNGRTEHDGPASAFTSATWPNPIFPDPSRLPHI
jgi:hypothetical protein